MRLKRISSLCLFAAVPLFLATSGFISAQAAVGGSTCNVPGDYPSIQAAVDDPGCKTILVAPGTYIENVVVPRAVEVLGPNSNRPGAGPRNPEAVVSDFNITASDVVLRGFTFSNATPSGQVNVSSAATILSGVAVGNNIFNGYDSVGMPTNNAGNLVVFANLFHNPLANTEAIQIKANPPAPNGGCTGSKVIGNVFNAASNNGAADVNLSCTFSNSKDVLVWGNKDSGIIAGTSFTAFSGVIDGIVVGNNNVTGTATAGDLVFFFGGMSGSTQILNNLLTGAAPGNAVSIQNILEGPNTGAFFIGHNNLSHNDKSVDIGLGAVVNPGSVTVHRNNLSGNATAGMQNSSTITADAVCNWWGSDTGPKNPAKNPGGTGDPAIESPGAINFKPWLESPDLNGQCGPEGGECHEGDGNGEFQGDHGHGDVKFDGDGCKDGDSDQVSSSDRGDGNSFQSTSIDSISVNSLGNTMTMIGSGTVNGQAVTFVMVAVESTLLTPGSVSFTFSDGYTNTGTLLNGSILLH